MVKVRKIDEIAKSMKESLLQVEEREKTTGKELYEERKQILCEAKVIADYHKYWELLLDLENWDTSSMDSDLCEFKRRFEDDEFQDLGFDELPDNYKSQLSRILSDQANSDEGCYEISTSDYENIRGVLYDYGIHSKNIDLIMKEMFLKIGTCHVYTEVIRPYFRQVIEEVTGVSHWKLNQGDIIKIDPVLFQLAQEFGRRDTIPHYKYFYLIKITKKKYHFAEIGSWQVHPLIIDSVWFNSVLSTRDQYISRVDEGTGTGLLLNEVKDLLRSFEEFGSPNNKKRLTSFYMSLSSYVISFLDDETKNKVNKIIKGA